jgi:transposase
MALIMIMVLALLVYFLAERKLRLQLAETSQSVPNQVGKGTQTPTMRWIFQVFEGIDLLLVNQNGQVVNRQVLNIRPEHLTVLRLLGPPVENCYLLAV